MDDSCQPRQLSGSERKSGQRGDNGERAGSSKKKKGAAATTSATEVFVSGRCAKEAAKLVELTTRGPERSPTAAKLQADLAVHITRSVGRPGSSVLIFVSGMGEIIDLVDRFEKLNEGEGGGEGVTYKVVAIHSDIPDEEQKETFKLERDRRTVKVVVATNAAESSITLSDVDSVICLGVMKQIEYNAGVGRAARRSDGARAAGNRLPPVRTAPIRGEDGGVRRGRNEAPGPRRDHFAPARDAPDRGGARASGDARTPPNAARRPRILLATRGGLHQRA